jgi:hypothetical protein
MNTNQQVQFLKTSRVISRAEAEHETRLKGREMEGSSAEFECLKCQLGWYRRELRIDLKGNEIEVEIFDLKGFGRTWADAAESIKARLFRPVSPADIAKEAFPETIVKAEIPDHYKEYDHD